MTTFMNLYNMFFDTAITKWSLFVNLSAYRILYSLKEVTFSFFFIHLCILTLI